MPSLHLACDELISVSLSVSPFPCGLCTEAAGGHTVIVRIIVRIHPSSYRKVAAWCPCNAHKIARIQNSLLS